MSLLTHSDLLSLNIDGTMLAVSFDNGALDIYDLRDDGEDMTLFPSSDFTQFEGGFYENYFALSASGGGQSIFAIIDRRRQEALHPRRHPSTHTQHLAGYTSRLKISW